jgi:fructosamine-3-kinase
MNDADLIRTIEGRLGVRIDSLSSLSGGCVGEVYAVRVVDGSSETNSNASGPLVPGDQLVVKIDRSTAPTLETEGFMLSYLARHTILPVPGVHWCDAGMLVMDHLPGSSSFDAEAQRHAAELLAQLHNITSDRAGLERDTLIGSLNQPNPWTDSWVAFFAQSRLAHMANEGVRAGRLPASVARRVHTLADRLGELIYEPTRCSLVHGDVWAGNVLAEHGCITGFIDPAIYFGHPEVELAFITLFSCFGEPFFERYSELRSIPDGFFEIRRHVYNVYPLLVHVRLFGGGYVQQVSGVLQSLGF